MISQISFRGLDIKYANNESFFKRVENGMWEVDTFDILDKYIQQGKTFIDTGSWNGILSIYAAKLGARVYSIEPDKVAYQSLVENIQANDLNKKITPFNLAISDKNGFDTLYSKEGIFGDSQSSLLSNNIHDEEMVIPTETLHSFLFRNKIKDICLIKIDCEGSEEIFIDESFRVALIEWNCPPIYISFHPTYFQNFVETVGKIYNILSTIYVFKDINFDTYSMRMINPNEDHSFILTAQK